MKRVVGGVERQFFDYVARGAPFGPDDGTVAPWVVVASLPFAPEIVVPTVCHLAGLKLGGQDRRYGFKPSFNQTLPRGRQPDRLVGDALLLRHRPGARGADDRERKYLRFRAPEDPHLLYAGASTSGFAWDRIAAWCRMSERAVRGPRDMSGPGERAHGTCRDRGESERALRRARAQDQHRADRRVDRSPGGYESDAELIEFAKKMKARQYARMLDYEDEESGLRIKRLWSFRDSATGRRYYADILQMPDDRRRQLVLQYAQFLDQLRSVRRAMADYFAGQQFFEFYVDEVQETGPNRRSDLPTSS